MAGDPAQDGHHAPGAGGVGLGTSQALADLVVQEMLRLGVRRVVVCPGSRSTPLVLALARTPGMVAVRCLDERSAGYLALGMARATGEPAGVVVTSGTAAANLVPCAAEARHGYVPLLLVTADRPPELQGVGALQTLDQRSLFQGVVKESAELAVPEAGSQIYLHARVTLARLVGQARALPQGPVHLNVPFREPLVGEGPSATTEGEDPQEEPYASYEEGEHLPGERALAWARSHLPGRRGVVVWGPLPHGRWQEGAFWALEVARTLGWPLLVDALSGGRGRLSPDPEVPIAVAYDAYLRDPQVAQALLPEAAVVVGTFPVSKALGQWLARIPHRLWITPGGFPDPELGAGPVWRLDPASALATLGVALKGAPWPPQSWRQAWSAAEKAATEALWRPLPVADGHVFEAWAVATAACRVGQEGLMYVGNSMPVRDLDGFLPLGGGPPTVLGHRGLSGIDGVVSSALGAGMATGRPVLAVVGDLSFLHDLGAWAAVRLNGLGKSVVVVPENGGGAIFSLLPQAQAVDPPLFRDLFAMPVHHPLGELARALGARYRQVGDLEALANAVEEGLGAEGVTVVGVAVPGGEENARLHQWVWRHAAQAVHKALGRVHHAP